MYSVVHNLIALEVDQGIAEKKFKRSSRIEYVTAAQVHPFRGGRKRRGGMAITPDSFGDLKSVVRGLAGAKRRRRRPKPQPPTPNA